MLCLWGGICLLIDNDCVIILVGDVDVWCLDKFEFNIFDFEIYLYYGFYVVNIILYIKNVILCLI